MSHDASCGFDLRPGTVTVLDGPPGAGRATVLACLTGDLPIRMSGAPAAPVAALDRYGMRLTHRTLGENIAMIQAAAGLDPAPPPVDVLAGVGLLDRLADRPVGLNAEETVLAGLAAALATIGGDRRR